MRAHWEPSRRFLRRTAVSLTLGVSLLVLLPAESFAAAVVRFVHAVPSVGKVAVQVTQNGATQTVGSIGFAGVTPWHNLKASRFRWALVAGGKTLAQGVATIGNSAYDIVVFARNTGVSLGVFKAQGGEPDKALIRVIHAAPELGSPQLRVDGKIAVPSLAFTQATPYVALAPGAHTLSANPAGDAAPIISAKVNLSADTAYSVVVVGSDGQQVRVVSLTDRGAPTSSAANAQPSSSSQSANAASITAGPAASTVTVQPGDSLWKIAAERLGGGATDEQIAQELTAIWNLNASRIGTGDPNLIFPGQRLRLPAGG